MEVDANNINFNFQVVSNKSFPAIFLR